MAASVAGFALLVSLYLAHYPGGRSSWEEGGGIEYLLCGTYVLVCLLAGLAVSKPDRRMMAYFVVAAGAAAGFNWDALISFPGATGFAGRWIDAAAVLVLIAAGARVTHHRWRRHPRRLVSPRRRRVAGALVATGGALLAAAQFVPLGSLQGQALTTWSAVFRPGLPLGAAVFLLAAATSVAILRPTATGLYVLGLGGFGLGASLALLDPFDATGATLSAGSLLVIACMCLCAAGATVSNWGKLGASEFEMEQRQTLAVVGVICLGLVVLFLAGLGHRNVIEAGLLPGLVAVIGAVVLLGNGLGRISAGGTERRELRWRRARGQAPPREAVYLTTMTPSAWRALRWRMRRRVVRHMGYRVAMFPFVFTLLVLGAYVEAIVGPLLGVLAAILLLWFMFDWLRRHAGGDPLLLCARVRSSWQGEPSWNFDLQDEGKQRMWDHALGEAHKIAVDVRAAAAIRPEGSLVSVPD